VLLDDLERDAGRSFTRYRGGVVDETGDERYGLALAGPDSLIREAFAETDFAPLIIPGGSQDDWDKAMEERARRAAEASTDLFALERPSQFFKGAPPAATPESTVLVSLRNLRPGGTLFFFALRFGVPRGASLVFMLPPVWITSGWLIPQAGDPDLRLSLNGLGPPFVATSVLGGTAVDSVFFSSGTPFGQFVPFFTVTGFTAAITIFEFAGWSGLF
jgi:hypothetical protein